MNNTEKKRQFLINAAYYLLIAAILYGILKYAAPIFLPFILAFLIALLLITFVPQISMFLLQ